jgi:hypothetical protein
MNCAHKEIINIWLFLLPSHDSKLHLIKFLERISHKVSNTSDGNTSVSAYPPLDIYTFAYFLLTLATLWRKICKIGYGHNFGSNNMH